MIELGPCEGTILSHRTRMIGDKLVVSLSCNVGSEQCEAIIWITDKAMGMARRALKVCGFDVDKQTLVELDTRPTLLAGRKVPLLVEEYNGKQTVRIELDQRADKATLDSTTAKLRAAKKTANQDEIPF